MTQPQHDIPNHHKIDVLNMPSHVPAGALTFVDRPHPTWAETTMVLKVQVGLTFMQRYATPEDLRKLGYVPASELEALRAELTPKPKKPTPAKKSSKEKR